MYVVYDSQLHYRTGQTKKRRSAVDDDDGIIIMKEQGPRVFAGQGSALKKSGQLNKMMLTPCKQVFKLLAQQAADHEVTTQEALRQFNLLDEFCDSPPLEGLEKRVQFHEPPPAGSDGDNASEGSPSRPSAHTPTSADPSPVPGVPAPLLQQAANLADDMGATRVNVHVSPAVTRARAKVLHDSDDDECDGGNGPPACVIHVPVAAIPGPAMPAAPAAATNEAVEAPADPSIRKKRTLTLQERIANTIHSQRKR